MDALVKSLSATLREKELKKRRQERISQVRLQTNSWTAKSRQNFNNEKSKQLSKIITKVSTELTGKAIENLETLTAQYEKELEDVGLAFRAAAELEDLEEVKKRDSLRHDSLAKERHREAILKVRKDEEQKKRESTQLQKRKSQVRVIEDYKAKFLVDRKPFRPKNLVESAPSKPKPKDYQQNLAKNLHIPPPPDENEPESASHAQQPHKRKTRNHLRKKPKSKRRKSRAPKPVVPGGFAKVVNAKKRVPKKSKRKHSVAVTVPVHPTSKRPHRLIHKKPKPIAPEVIFYDASLPRKPQKYIAPPGIVRKESVDENRPNAWELGEQLTEGMVQDMAAKSVETVKEKKAAEERGIIAMRKAKLEQRYKQLEAELTSDKATSTPELKLLADAVSQVEVTVPAITTVQGPVQKKSVPVSKPKAATKEQFNTPLQEVDQGPNFPMTSSSTQTKLKLDTASQAEITVPPIKIMQGPVSIGTKPAPKSKPKEKQQSSSAFLEALQSNFGPQTIDSSTTPESKLKADAASQVEVTKPAITIVQGPVLVQKKSVPVSKSKPVTKEQFSKTLQEVGPGPNIPMTSSSTQTKLKSDAASQAETNVPPIKIIQGPLSIGPKPAPKPKPKEKEQFSAALLETLQKNFGPQTIDSSTTTEQKLQTNSASQVEVSKPAITIVQGPVLVQKKSVPVSKPKAATKEQFSTTLQEVEQGPNFPITSSSTQTKLKLDTASQAEITVPPIKIMQGPVSIGTKPAPKPKPKDKEQFSAAFLEALERNFGPRTIDSSTTPEQDTSTSIENYSPSQTPLTNKKAIRHYIKKLLYMRPESVEALKVPSPYSSTSTAESSPSSMVHVNTSAIGSIVMSSTTSSERIDSVHTQHSATFIPHSVTQTPEINVNVQYESMTTTTSTSSSFRVLSDRTNTNRPQMPLPPPSHRPSDISLAGILSNLCHHQEYCLATSIHEEQEIPGENQSSEGELVSFQGRNPDLDSSSPFMRQMRLEAITSPEQLEHIRKGGNASNYVKSGSQTSNSSGKPSREQNRGILAASDIQNSSRISFPKNPSRPSSQVSDQIEKLAKEWAKLSIEKPPWLYAEEE